MSWVSGIYAALLAILLSSIAESAEVECLAQWNDKNAANWPSQPRPTAANCAAAVIRGTISKGDFAKVVSLYRPNHPYLGTFVLVSPGGDMDEAIKIGRFFRKYLIYGVASLRLARGDESRFEFAGWPVNCSGQDCACASACALVWFGAPDRAGTVGLHRPYYSELGAFGALAPTDAASAYTQVLDRISQYLEEMEVPRPVVEKMISTSSGDIEWLTENRSNLPPSFTEWQDAACGHFTSHEQDAWGELSLKDGRSKYEQLLYDDLTKKMLEKSQCHRHLVSMNRQKLPAP